MKTMTARKSMTWKTATVTITKKKSTMAKPKRSTKMKTSSPMTKYRTTNINNSTRNLYKKSAPTRRRASKIQTSTVTRISTSKKSTIKKPTTAKTSKKWKNPRDSKKKAGTSCGTIKMKLLEEPASRCTSTGKDQGSPSSLSTARATRTMKS